MPVVDANTVITTLTVAAGLALGVERTIELLKYYMASAKGSLSKQEILDLIHRAQQVVAEVRAAMAGQTDITPTDIPTPAESAPAPVFVADTPVTAGTEQYPAPAITVVPPTPLSLQQTQRQLFYKLYAAGMGIILAQIFKIRMLALLLGAAGLPEQNAQLLFLPDMIFTGLVIGGGSQPIHVLITFLTERKVTLPQTQEVASRPVQQARPLADLVTSASLVEDVPESDALQWKDIGYQGGVNPASLQMVHLRPANPNTVVFHHTAMASNKSFEEIVDEFLVAKKWLTGYHCVIMPDGAIKPFCRWDRAGNHALGHNARSLGIAFHGNFHTIPGDSFSNADGRYGNQLPTEAQLHSGARVVALWANLYPEIKLDFEQNILPHKLVTPGHTVCPGSNFSYDQFKRLICDYHQAWSIDAEAQQKIASFRQLNYIYI